MAKYPKLPHKGAITPAAGAHGNFQLRPITAMLELARGTALSDDPGVAGFARRWSTLRHLGLFARNAQTGKLHLDEAALKYIGANQRRVLSEDLGIGFGIIVAKRWCTARTPGIGPVTAIDVDKALHQRSVPRLQLAGSRQPDYLLAYSDPTNPRVKIYDLLETKGTVSKSTASGQLSRAVTQLAGLTVGGQQMTGIAVSTVSNEDGVLVMAVDPEERPVAWEPTNEALGLWRTAARRARQDNVQLDVPAEDFFATATNVEYASLAEFGGQQGVARWLPNLDSDRRGDANTEVRRETEAGTFLGAEYVIEIPGTLGRLRLYQGVEERIVDGLRALDVTAVMDAQRAFAEVHASETGTSSAGAENAGPVSTFTSDGSMLELSIG